MVTSFFSMEVSAHLNPSLNFTLTQSDVFSQSCSFFYNIYQVISLTIASTSQCCWMFCVVSITWIDVWDVDWCISNSSWLGCLVARMASFLSLRSTTWISHGSSHCCSLDPLSFSPISSFRRSSYWIIFGLFSRSK